MRCQWKFKIADIIWELNFDKEYKRFRLNKYYKKFFSSDPPDVKINVHYKIAPPFPLKNLLFKTQSWCLYENNREEAIFIPNSENPFVVGIFNKDFLYGEVYHIQKERYFLKAIFKKGLIFPLYPLDEILMINLLADKAGILVHACGIEYNGEGYLFLGESGSGKSSLAQLWPKGMVLSDERMIIREDNGSFYIYGTPWVGEKELFSEKKSPLKKIFFLKISSENRINPLDRKETSIKIISCCFAPYWKENKMSLILAFIQRLIEKIPAYELEFSFKNSHCLIEFIKRCL